LVDVNKSAKKGSIEFLKKANLYTAKINLKVTPNQKQMIENSIDKLLKTKKVSKRALGGKILIEGIKSMLRDTDSEINNFVVNNRLELEMVKDESSDNKEQDDDISISMPHDVTNSSFVNVDSETINEQPSNKESDISLPVVEKGEDKSRKKLIRIKLKKRKLKIKR